MLVAEAALTPSMTRKTSVALTGEMPSTKAAELTGYQEGSDSHGSPKELYEVRNTRSLQSLGLVVD
jgi:hypothetical protein